MVPPEYVEAPILEWALAMYERQRGGRTPASAKRRTRSGKGASR